MTSSSTDRLGSGRHFYKRNLEPLPSKYKVLASISDLPAPHKEKVGLEEQGLYETVGFWLEKQRRSAWLFYDLRVQPKTQAWLDIKMVLRLE